MKSTCPSFQLAKSQVDLSTLNLEDFQVDLRSSRQVDLVSSSFLASFLISLHPLLLIFIHLQLKT